MPINNCIEQVTNGNVSFSESGCKLIVDNTQKIEFKKIRVDGCLPIDGMRCDYALVIEIYNENILIELKGSRFKDAVEQLENTYNWFIVNYNISPSKCFVVMSNRCPSLSGKIQNLKERFKKRTGMIITTIRSGNKIEF